jgi:hypothetical protein
MAAMTYRINKKLQLDGTDYAAGTEVELDIPDDLRDSLVKQRIIALPTPAEPAIDAVDKKAK